MTIPGSQSQVAVITGGTSGIGLATARRLLARDHKVAVFSQRSESVDAAREELTREFGHERVIARSVDLAVPAQIDAFFRDLRAIWGHPTVLVCNAGVSPKGPDGATVFHDIELAEWNEVLAVNLTGAMLCCQAVCPAMMERRFGRIVMIGSVASRTRPKIAGASYVASKAALSGLARSLVSTYAPYGITSNLVAPGRIATNMAGEPDSPTNRAALAAIPSGRLGQPDDVAAVVEFLISQEAGFVNGAIIDINGGEFIPV
ncbi:MULTISPECIES: SDR family oxidoreductase [unclassified Mesorhizobium]|uniref:SDR family oxidoreductase n=1 Tax=unclassified Mesorhizobium TaxID=325217 RepID=UPI001126D61C|nr:MULTISPECIES: SDR family oxidoreductase [unclassified Mesorhizobium]MBZ9739786.1 SDR family oxidoreductase [Mesorhizobium sp. CO1-1-4]MBZ9804950.1 SDR family oxidoreductase [Mesorhizobium sp. ES1-6]TPL88695.1 SDR family oxidoreductase [Mesorhizobium sp. B2-3-12]